MWHRVCSRKDVLDILIFNRDIRATKIYSLVDLTKIFIPKEEFVLVWDKDPLKTGGLPFLIIIDEFGKPDFFAAINASPNSIKPISAFCRILTPSEFKTVLNKVTLPNLESIQEGILGLIFCEAIIHGAGNLKLDDLTPSACRRTFSNSLAKAIASGYDNQTLSVISENWLEALKFSDFSDGRSALEDVVASLRNIGFVANNLNNKNVHGIIDEFCTNLLNGHKDNLEKTWYYLTNSIQDMPSIREFSEATREKRVDYFNYIVNKLLGFKVFPEHADFIIAFLATQISPGTLNHMTLLLPSVEKESSILLWYGFLAGLQSTNAFRKYKEGLGERLLRDLLKFESLEEAPNSDISLNELKVLSRIESYSQSIKTGYPNLIQVEIYPLISSLFRLGNRSSKQEIKTDTLESRAYLPPETFANITNAIKLLEKASLDVANAINFDSKNFQLTISNETKAKKVRKSRSY